MIGRRSKKPDMEEKILDVNASMQGNIIFKDPVNLKINGKFEGSLTAKGLLTVGENAEVSADLIGENIVVAGNVSGDIIAEKTLKLVSPARVTGNIRTPNLVITEGALLHGNCHMIFDEEELTRVEMKNDSGSMSAEEVAKYLEVESSLVLEWAAAGSLRGKNENGKWRFNKEEIDRWIKAEKIR